MKRLLILGLIPLLIYGIIGCGEDDPGTPTGSTQEIVKGLSDGEYLNSKFGVKITYIPDEGWTVKDFGNEGQGMLESSSQGYIPMYHLLLMEPVPEDEFVTLNSEESISPVLEAGIPFIWVALDYAEGANFQTSDLSDNLTSYASLHGAEIESKKFVSIGNATAIQATLNRTFGKEALTWFAKGEIIVRCEYIAAESEFEKYYIPYIQTVQSIWLMGN